MKTNVDRVDDMANSRIKRELKKYGIDPTDVLREHLKEYLRKAPPSALQSNDDSSPPRTRSQKKGGKQLTFSRKRKKLQEDEAFYDVEKLMDVKSVEDPQTTLPVRQFKVRWKGYGPEDDQWLTEADLSLPPEKYKQDVIVIEKMNSLIQNI